jgi:hypothetical protein
MPIDTGTRYGIERELLERVAALEAEAKRLAGVPCDHHSETSCAVWPPDAWRRSTWLCCLMEPAPLTAAVGVPAS